MNLAIWGTVLLAVDGAPGPDGAFIDAVALAGKLVVRHVAEELAIQGMGAPPRRHLDIVFEGIAGAAGRLVGRVRRQTGAAHGAPLVQRCAELLGVLNRGASARVDRHFLDAIWGGSHCPHPALRPLDP
jgi:hypothetical protein